ncbi:putative hydrolase of the HAD superfamily [Treponema bryantii]|uniref:Putative hydrolase of the HAD superfamily n=1 Tax=Treponema bryantii TaxID=163 RepID=A0A1I3LBV1_9SPIR|nr:HAD family hydrolase [Treponema bryantii]SFI82234.1 putative hydrolase of the HAD superfamily [Treponema bryantii]
MKIYKIPTELKAFIFDIDSTLYTNQAYAFEQVDCQVRQFAKERGITADEARRMVADYRKKFAAEHNGSKVSLGNTLLAFGVPIEQSVQWRRELLEPADFLGRDEQLIETLKILQSKYKLICVTNNPVLPARKTLEAIGVSEFFPDIVGLDTCLKSKPALEPFQTAVERLGEGIKAENCLAVGDRYDMDIALPLEMGMGGILVSGVEEVYQISKSVL